VSEKAANTIETYPVDHAGRAGAGTAHASSGPAPFGFSAGRDGTLFFSEAKASALSSYTTAGGGFAVITASLANGQGAACWTALTHNGRYVYTANAATDSISGYAVADDGSVSLVMPGGATAQLAAGTHPLDEAVSRDDQFLYVNGANAHVIDALAINADGSLTPVGSFGALPAGNAGLIAQ
jgi:6-phosphogluconolactonase